MTRHARARRTSRAARGVVAVAALSSFAAAAQARGQAAPRSPWALFSARYDTRTSDFIYAAYGYGREFAMVGVLHNPRSGYSEVLGAVGTTVAGRAGESHLFAIGAARASDAWYAQLYYLPNVRVGAVRVRATSELYLPLGVAGTAQAALSPLSATLTLAPRVEAGLAADVAAARGDRTETAIGPEVRVSIPKAVLGVDAQRLLDGPGGRLRVFMTTAF